MQTRLNIVQNAMQKLLFLKLGYKKFKATLMCFSTHRIFLTKNFQADWAC